MVKKSLHTLALIGAATVLFSGLSSGGQSMPAMPGMEHHHHEEAGAAERLGHVHFPVSCLPASQGPFERGIALLHSFGYTEAETQFRAIAAADPTCAMAHWGVAMSEFHELWGHPDNAALKTGADEMAKADQMLAKPAHAISDREVMYIAALSAFYAKAAQNYMVAADAYTALMSALHTKYPDDIEAAAFYALSILADVAPDDTSLTKERQALAVLVPLFQKNPEHPGLAHYIIHTCDTPALAAQGLDAAKVYAKIAPSSPHATHMPGHIFARLGMWPEDIASNLASVAASQKAEADGQPGVAHQMHADEFLIYAYLQIGDDPQARALTESMHSIGQHVDTMPGMDDMKGMGPYFTNELEAIYAMEMHDWKLAETLQPEAGSESYAKFDSYWANGVGAGHLRDVKATEAALAKIDAFMTELRKGPRAYEAVGFEVPQNEVAGWAAFAARKPDEAIVLMRKAADQQDKLGQGEVDIPAREMLGDLLMLEQKPAAALAEYAIALKLSPNRLNGLLGAGSAAEAAGDKKLAAVFYSQAAHNTGHGAHTSRPEVAHAIQFSEAAQTAVAAR